MNKRRSMAPALQAPKKRLAEGLERCPGCLMWQDKQALQTCGLCQKNSCCMNCTTKCSLCDLAVCPWCRRDCSKCEESKKNQCFKCVPEEKTLECFSCGWSYCKTCAYTSCCKKCNKNFCCECEKMLEELCKRCKEGSDDEDEEGEDGDEDSCQRSSEEDASETSDEESPKASVPE